MADRTGHAPPQRNKNTPPHQEEAQRLVADKTLKHAMQYMRTPQGLRILEKEPTFV
ncbi:MAG: hypothetical protein KA748_05765 [Halomonas sp.]|nr:hypothetical protein [Halomonas sp.]MBP5979691.1 hypothetical protein [Halomonas sp.]